MANLIKNLASEKCVKDGEDELVDITSIVERAASVLTYSKPLLCNENTFSLQDSMAALELMDPIMDCCEIDASCYSRKNSSVKGDQKVPPQIAPKSLKGDTQLPWEDLTLHHARLFVMKEICCLDSMLSGFSVIESTFTCLYAHDGILHDMRSELNSQIGNDSFPKNAPKWAIYASALILAKLSEAIRNIVIHADIYEEEDFTPNADPFRFFPIMEEKEVIETVSYVVKQLASLGNNDNQSKDAEIMAFALDFQLQMFLSCSTLATLTKENVKTAVESVKNIIIATNKTFDQLLSNIDDKEEGTKNYDDDEFLSKIFDPFVNRRLLGSTPVRKTKFKDVLSSIRSLKAIFQEFDWAVCDLILKGDTLGRIQRMLSHISISSVNILSRSIIVLNLYFDDLLLGQYQLGVLIINHMQQIGGVPQTMLVSEKCFSFLHRLGKPVYETLKVLVLNRNRQATYIETLMLKDWVNIQKEASALDYLYREELQLDPRTTPFVTNYVLSTIIWILQHHLSISIELDLFTGHYDLSIAFWYWDFLLSNQISITNSMLGAKAERLRIQQSIAEKEEKTNIGNEASKAGRGKKKGKKGSNGKKGGNQNKGKISTPVSPEMPIEDLEDQIYLLVLNLKRTLCRGTVRFIAALNQAGICKKPEFEFTSHEKRFEKRFGYLKTVSHPTALTYDDYVQGSDFSGVVQLDLINSASECFKSAKIIVDTIVAKSGKIDESYLAIRRQEVTKLAKVSIGNSLYLHKLIQHIEKGNRPSDLTVQFDFKTHNQFCSIILK